MSSDQPGDLGLPEGVRLRRQLLSSSAEERGFQADAEFPHLWGVVVDYSIGEAIVTVAALRDGTASLYTDATFGIIGGHVHPKVREAAIECVQAVNLLWPEVSEHFSAAPDSAYPAAGEVSFYLLGYQETRRGGAPELEIYTREHLLTPIFAYAQGVITALRLASGWEPDEGVN